MGSRELSDDDELNKLTKDENLSNDSDNSDVDDLALALSQNSVKDDNDFVKDDDDSSIEERPLKKKKMDNIEDSNNNSGPSVVIQNCGLIISEEIRRINESQDNTRESQTQSSNGVDDNGNTEDSAHRENKRIEELKEECAKRAYLDGRFFKVIPEKTFLNGKITAICQLCPKDNTHTASFQCPSNLFKHLKTVHKHAIPLYKTHKEELKEKSKGGAPMRKSIDVLQKQYEHNCTAFIVGAGVPLFTIEDPQFRKIIDDLPLKGNQKLKHMSRRTLVRRIGHTYEEQTTTIKKTLTEQPYVCTTTDVWSNSTHRYLRVTVHWIEKETLEQKSAAIACRRFPGTHSFDRIAEHLESIHTEFGLDTNKIIATVTDNASNFAKAFREFGIVYSDGPEKEKETTDTLDAESSEESDCEFNLSDDEEERCSPEEVEELHRFLPKHFKCIPHTLSLLATTDVSKIINASKKLKRIHSDAISRCNVLWKLMGSPKQEEKVIEILGHILRRPTVVRWNSCYDALVQIINEEEKIFQMIEKLSLKNSLREIDMRYIKEYVRCLEPVAEAIDKLQGEKDCTYGYLLPNLVSLRNKLSTVLSEGQLLLSRPLVTGLLEGLDKRFKQFFNVEAEGEIAALAAVLHPKFKGLWLECLSTDAQNRVKNLVLKEISSHVSQTQNPPVPTQDEFYNFGTAVSTGVNVIFGYADQNNELQNFLVDRRTQLLMLNSYPTIRKLYIKYNTPLSSSAPVERLFSYAGMTSLPRQNRLTPTNFEKRVLARIYRAKNLN